MYFAPMAVTPAPRPKESVRPTPPLKTVPWWPVDNSDKCRRTLLRVRKNFHQPGHSSIDDRGSSSEAGRTARLFRRFSVKRHRKQTSLLTLSRSKDYWQKPDIIPISSLFFKLISVVQAAGLFQPCDSGHGPVWFYYHRSDSGHHGQKM